MQTITEKVAYLKGLAEGLALDEGTKEGKLIANIIDVLDEMALFITEMDDSVAEMGAYVDRIDEDLADVEEVVFDEDCDCGCDCDCDDDDLDGVECPNCGNIVYLDVDDFDDDEEILCPNCNEPLFEDEDNEEE